jgi:hypothetical protein
MRISFKTIVLLFAVLQWYSCATVVAPTGGPKDVTPPKVLKSLPGNFSTGFKSKTIVLYFSEFVQVKDLDNQLIISPPLKRAPDVKVKGKSIIVQFNDTLKDNTTYNINFGGAISDITESNLLDNFQYVFSTGPSIDSLFVKGKVINARTLLPEKDVLVMLYDQFSDSLPYKERPLYFAKSKENGAFKITNLKQGAYKLVALKDGNANYLFDQPSEKIAFVQDTVFSASEDTLTLRLFEDQNNKQHLVKARSAGFGKIVFVFAKPENPLTVQLLEQGASKKEWAITEYSIHKDTLTYWYTDPPADSLHFVLTTNNGKADTIHVALEKQEKKSKIKFRLDVKSNISGGPFQLNSPVLLETSHPIKNYTAAAIQLFEDSTKITNYTFSQTDSALRHFSLSYPWKENTKYKVYIPAKTFYDIYDLPNDTLVYSFKTKAQDDYGKMALKLTFPKPGHYIVQLLDEKDHVIRENDLDSQGYDMLYYNYLDPAKYALNIVEDSNGNRRWDSGTYLKKAQPEKIRIYHELISIRANWDVEIDWKIKE